MLNSTLKPNYIQVSTALWEACKDFLSIDRKRAFKENDASKELEMDLCKALFPNEQLDLPNNQQEEFKEIDLWISGESVQIKCRSSRSFMTLEDFKTTSTGGKTSWVDRSVAQYTIFITPVDDSSLKYFIYETSDLKRLLNILRYHRNKEPLHFLDKCWVNNYFPKWEDSTYNIYDSSAIFKVPLS